ncbi:hypothetical protein M1146_00090, partial [Patescibacteria group bacterium]|nr:hypothetical protein [Patescibacteria group bacterium]
MSKSGSKYKTRNDSSDSDRESQNEGGGKLAFSDGARTVEGRGEGARRGGWGGGVGRGVTGGGWSKAEGDDADSVSFHEFGTQDDGRSEGVGIVGLSLPATPTQLRGNSQTTTTTTNNVATLNLSNLNNNTTNINSPPTPTTPTGSAQAGRVKVSLGRARSSTLDSKNQITPTTTTTTTTTNTTPPATPPNSGTTPAYLRLQATTAPQRVTWEMIMPVWGN